MDSQPIKKPRLQEEPSISESAEFLLEAYYERFIEEPIQLLTKGWCESDPEMGKYNLVRDLCKMCNSDLEEFDKYLSENGFNQEELSADEELRNSYNSLISIASYANGKPIDKDSEIKTGLTKLTKITGEDCALVMKKYFRQKIDSFLQSEHIDHLNIARKHFGIDLISNEIPSTDTKTSAEKVTNLSEQKEQQQK